MAFSWRKAIISTKWRPDSFVRQVQNRTISVWARLQGLPFPLWNKEGLSLAASMVGKPLASDEATIKCSRLEYARVCIEVDASVPLINHFQVVSHLSEDPITVDVSYEWKPSRCAKCLVFGHACKDQDGQVENKGKRDEVAHPPSLEEPIEQAVVKEPREQVQSKAQELVTVDDESSDKERPQTVDVPLTHKSKDMGKEEEMATEASENSVQLVKNLKGKQQMVHDQCMENKMDSLAVWSVGEWRLGKGIFSGSTGGKPREQSQMDQTPLHQKPKKA
ncbi:ZINC KNUCKLE CX2CX4HX4C-RELATED [Salix viminalis]|uniref:ZINC KNUCKLE CX2CX4HX4C-RELATED n=1 Tax=Salix viminalis TaxID=40686 RepID=A0A9Q0Z3H7_SALVM|nr:ZINC KNUCKLE CX2CX4HX4C-RELATED [Salix viminalis]